MVKFNELFEFVAVRIADTTCDCCQTLRTEVTIYKTETSAAVLCNNCRDFVEGILNK
jgi:hypothetical protein